MGTAEQKVTKANKLPIYCRHIDDISVRAETANDVLLAQTTGLNSTTEKSKDGKLPLLDVLTKLNGAKFETEVVI